MYIYILVRNFGSASILQEKRWFVMSIGTLLRTIYTSVHKNCHARMATNYRCEIYTSRRKRCDIQMLSIVNTFMKNRDLNVFK